MSKDKEQPKNEPTGHKRVRGEMNEGAAQSPDTGSMPMGMTGEGDSEGDPTQKSTHNAPNTEQSSLADGSPKFQDIAKGKNRKAPIEGPHKAGKFRVKSPIGVAYHVKNEDGEKSRHLVTHEIGEVVELDADTANSVHEHVEKV